MGAIEFRIERDEEAGLFIASSEDPDGGGISTQAETFAELEGAIREAIGCHFVDRPRPREVILHFEEDPVLQLA